MLTSSENYFIWAPQLILVLTRNDLEDYVDGTSLQVTKPTAAVSTRATDDDAAIKVYKEWKSGNADAMLTITININPEPLTLITGCSTAKEMWDTLRELYKGSGVNLRQNHIDAITSLNFAEFRDVHSFVVEFKTIVNSLASIDSAAPTDWYTSLFIKAVGKTYPVWADRQRSLARTKPLALSELYCVHCSKPHNSDRMLDEVPSKEDRVP
jgi:hypothetical protein